MTTGVFRVGLQAPDFTATAVVDQEFKEISLSQYRGKYVVLFFYPLDFTFVCPTEITAFSDRYDAFKALNTEVLGVSVDSQFSHLAWIQTERKQGGLGDIAYPLVADLKKEIASRLQRSGRSRRRCPARSVHHQPRGCCPARHRQQPAGGPQRGGDPARASGLPAR